MLAQLGPKRALDQRLFQLFEQPVLSGQVLRLRVVRKQFVQKFGGNRRISRHVSLPLKVNSQKPTYTLFLTPSLRTALTIDLNSGRLNASESETVRKIITSLELS